MPFSGCWGLIAGLGLNAWAFVQLEMAPGLDWWLCYGIHLKLLSSVLAPTSGTVRAMGMDPMRDRVRYVSRIGVVFGWRTDLWWDQPESASFEWKRVVWDIPRDRYERMLGLAREAVGSRRAFRQSGAAVELGAEDAGRSGVTRRGMDSRRCAHHGEADYTIEGKICLGDADAVPTPDPSGRRDRACKATLSTDY